MRLARDPMSSVEGPKAFKWEGLQPPPMFPWAVQGGGAQLVIATVGMLEEN